MALAGAGKLLIRSLTSFPHTIDFVARVVAWNVRNGREVQKEKWERVTLASLERNTNLGNDSEVCWLLWLMKEVEISVPPDIIYTLIARCGVLPIVMFLQLNPLPRQRRRIVQGELEGRIGPNPFKGSQWLLAHEALVAGWLPATQLDRTSMSPFMDELAAAKVSFFDTGAQPHFMKDEDEDETEDFAIEDMAGRYDDDEDEDHVSRRPREDDDF
jgi:hypothetical protein